MPPPPPAGQDAILDVVTSGQIAWDGLQQRAVEPFKSLGTRCLVFGNGDDDVEVSEKERQDIFAKGRLSPWSPHRNARYTAQPKIGVSTDSVSQELFDLVLWYILLKDVGTQLVKTKPTISTGAWISNEMECVNLPMYVRIVGMQYVSSCGCELAEAEDADFILAR